MSNEIATFGAGCFWGVEYKFSQIHGVLETAVGYMGGDKTEPTYKEVCTDTTGHAEVCQVVFDPEQVSYQQILAAFWQLHDPTQLNRQGPDFGSQYRTVIFTHTPEQQQLAEASKKALTESGRYQRPIATQIIPADNHIFWPAEEYHQKYIEKTGSPSCHI